jgi:hypothetical protein
MNHWHDYPPAKKLDLQNKGSGEQKTSVGRNKVIARAIGAFVEMPKPL